MGELSILPLSIKKMLKCCYIFPIFVLLNIRLTLITIININLCFSDCVNNNKT